MRHFWWIFLAFVLPAVILSCSKQGDSGGPVAYALQEDEVEDEVEVEGDEMESTASVDEDSEEEGSRTSKDVDTILLFTNPVHNTLSTLELPAGGIVEFLIGFTNKGEIDYTVETINTSFRYPMDYSFHIQNFSNIAYNKVIKPNHEATFAYSFMPAEQFAGRPFGLNINLAYKDANGISYSQAIFNETVQIVELDQGLDGETVFLYIFLAACVVLALVGGQQLLSSFGRKTRLTSRKPTVEIGTANPNNVDYDWIPKETLNLINKNSPKTPKQSPRQRKTKRTVGFDD